jgi:hypothetical protein
MSFLPVREPVECGTGVGDDVAGRQAMAKFDWGKASLRELDPARVQRTVDFVTPDPVVVKKKKKRKGEAASPSIWATALAAVAKARKQQDAGKPAKGGKKMKALAKPKTIPQPRQKLPRLTEEERQAANEAQRKARAAHQERYLAKASKEQAAMAAKKKTHLQAWIEKQDGLQSDRKTLRQQWRDRILRRPDEK